MDTEQQKNKSILGATTAVWALSPNGVRLALKIRSHLSSAHLFMSTSIETPPYAIGKIHRFKRLSDSLAQHFNEFDCHFFIFSTGIAVRLLAPLLSSKLKDPAVVVFDDHGQFAISLVSGHIGRANAYAVEMSRLLDAVPVITTATDVNHVPAIDLIAQEQELYIENSDMIKQINMAFLKGRPIRVYDPLNVIASRIPRRYVRETTAFDNSLDVSCTWQLLPVPRETLILRPKNLIVGIGCNRNTNSEVIRNFFLEMFEKEGFSRHSVALVATTDLKRDETGILSLAEFLKVNLRLFSKDQLNSVKGIENPSAMAQKHIGVKSVCEAAAILASKGGKLIMPKQKNKDVTLAVAKI